MRHTKLSVPIIVLAFLLIFQNGCSQQGGKRDVQFGFVDPMEKVLAEASYFPQRDAMSEVVCGEYASRGINRKHPGIYRGD